MRLILVVPAVSAVVGDEVRQFVINAPGSSDSEFEEPAAQEDTQEPSG